MRDKEPTTTEKLIGIPQLILMSSLYISCHNLPQSGCWMYVGTREKCGSALAFGNTKGSSVTRSVGPSEANA